VVPDINPVTLLTKEPVPDPFEVKGLRLMVGFGDVLQATPLDVTGEPPSEVTLPPLVREF
jgi:hypothetical protein